MKKIIIIGAGIIGLIFAKELSKFHIKCEIYDLKSNISENADKASGILSKTGLNKININFSSSIENKLNGAIIHSNNQKIELKKNTIIAYIINRKKIIEVLYGELKNNKYIKFKFNTKIGKKDLIKLKRNKNNIIIGADGAISSVASVFNFPKINEYVLTYKAIYSNANIQNIHFVELFFNNNLSNGFFSWTAPHSNSKIEIGIGISSNKKINSKHIFNKFIQKKCIKHIILNAKIESQYASIIPIATRKKTIIDNVILIGDSAGQVKSSTGGGIIFGAMCAKIAANVVYKNLKNNEPLQNYEKRWRKKYLFDLRIHKLIHYFYSNISNKNFSFFLIVIKFLNINKLLSKHGDMDSLIKTIKNIITNK